MMKCPRPAYAGFTLIELSIALIIISFIASAMLTIAGRRTESDRREITLERMKRIEEALGSYVLENKRLPCPADGSLAFTDSANGVADTLSATPPTPVHCANTVVTGHTTRLGTVPVVTLGLSDEYMLDGWNRRLTYVVDENFIEEDDFVRPAPDPYDPDWVDPAGAINILTQDDSDFVAAQPLADQPQYSRSTTAIYVLISHGVNGHGAWARNGGTRINRIGSLTISLAERENSPYPNVDDMEFTQERAQASFDDLLTYREYDQIIELAGGYTDETLCKSAYYSLLPYDAALPITAGPVGCLNVKVDLGTYNPATPVFDWLLEGNCAYRQEILASAINDLCFVSPPP